MTPRGKQLLRGRLLESVMRSIVRVPYHIGKPEDPDIVPTVYQQSFFSAAHSALAAAAAGKSEGFFT
jgi:hypothetical protein